MQYSFKTLNSKDIRPKVIDNFRELLIGITCFDEKRLQQDLTIYDFEGFCIWENEIYIVMIRTFYSWEVSYKPTQIPNVILLLLEE